MKKQEFILEIALVLYHHFQFQKIQNTIIEWVSKIAQEIKVVGLMNTQLAIKNNEVYVLEVNPRASRTVPFVAKARNIPIAKIAAKVMTGDLLKEILKN